jgi:hypothetical protein
MSYRHRLSLLKSVNQTWPACTAQLPPAALEFGIGTGSRNSPEVVIRPRIGSFEV